MAIKLNKKGGDGSGDFDHGGRPGEVGGSEASGTGARMEARNGGANGEGRGSLNPNQEFLPKKESQPTEKQKLGKYTIEHSTEKAHLISADGKKMWIQKRWISDEGKLSKGAQAKFDAQPTEQIKQEAIKEAHRINGHDVKAWNPSNEKGRLYFADKSFIDVSTKEATPHGYYESHRYAKGERSTVSFVTHSGGGLAKDNLQYASRQHLSMAGAGDKILIKTEDGKWQEHHEN